MKRVILVEDDPAIRDVVRLVLEKENIDVKTLASSAPVLNNEITAPDLFILDKQLSGVDGLDLCRYLKQQPATTNVPVIMLSANPQILELAKLAGADGALEKPFRMKEFKELVLRCLG